jgi:hypothetical protein
MKGTGTEFPISKHKYGYQGRPQPVKVKGQTPRPEDPGPARAIVQERRKSPGKYIFHGVVSHDEKTQGQDGQHAHGHIPGEVQPESKKGLDKNGEAMRNLFG